MPMDTLTLRILETISTNLGNSMSINKLAEKIRNSNGTAYYANIYQKLQNLRNDGIVNLDRIGKSSSIKLCFQNYRLVDTLAEMEIEKKKRFLSNKSHLIILLSELEDALSGHCALKSVIAADPDRNLKLNRLEILLFLSKTPDYHDDVLTLSRETQGLQNKHNFRIDSLILNDSDFQSLAAAEEINPVREILGNRVILFGSEAFWRQMKIIEQKTEIKTTHETTKPTNIPETDLTYNLGRFGYREFGRPFHISKKICVEYIATALLLQDDIRLREATSVILAKNHFIGNLLAFLTLKFETASSLLGILKPLQELKSSRDIEQTIDLLSLHNIQQSPTDKQNIEAKLRLYNAL